MKRYIAVCLCVCIFLASCGTHGKEETESAFENASAPDGSGSNSVEESASAPVQIPAEAAALLDTLLGEEQGFTAEREDGIVEWIAFDRVGELRERVNAIETPFLTEESVLQVAERTAAFYCGIAEQGKTVALPAFERISSQKLNTLQSPYTTHLSNWNLLFAYTVYLFTPSKYLFSQLETGVLAEHGEDGKDFDFYAMLAGNYATRPDALASLREEKRCVVLHMNSAVWQMSTVNLSLHFLSCSLLQGKETPLDLTPPGESMALRFRPLLAQETYRKWLCKFTIPGNLPGNDRLDSADGETYMKWHVLLPDGAVKEIRETVEFLGAPLLTEHDVRSIVMNDGLHASLMILPGETREEEIWLDPWEEDRAVLCYLFDLFTPSSYRFTDLLDLPGAYYALQGDYESPKEALAAFAAGETYFLWVGEDGRVGTVNGTEQIVHHLFRDSLDGRLQALQSGYTAIQYIDYLDDGRSAYSFIDGDRAARLRETVDRMNAPYLTFEKAAALTQYLWAHIDSATVFLLPDADGTGEVLLDPLALGREAVLARTVSYYIDLFTPRAYRFTDGIDPPGIVYYILKGSYRTPEETLASFEKGDAAFVQVTENAYSVRGERRNS